MARYAGAVWAPISGPAGPYQAGPKRVVHHKTQGDTLAGARGAYKTNRSDPHFTVHPAGVEQHVDTNLAARALRNAQGGVETNRQSAIQIEIVGHSGTTMPASTMRHLCGLLVWLRDVDGVPWVWPNGRPPTSSATGYGQNTKHRSTAVWTRSAGHYGHSNVPENSHWDPAYTDAEWDALNAHMAPQPKDDDMTPDQAAQLKQVQDETRGIHGFAVNTERWITDTDKRIRAIEAKLDQLLARG